LADRLLRSPERHGSGESPAGEVAMKSSSSAFPPVCEVEVCQRSSHLGGLATEPGERGALRQRLFRGPLVVEDLGDGRFGHLGGDPSLAELGREESAATGPEPEAVAHEGAGERGVVYEPSLLELVQTGANDGCRESFPM